MPAPAIKLASGIISKFLTAMSIGVYAPNKTRIKPPDMPGSIVAQMAMAPATNKYQEAPSDSTGLIKTTATAMATPTNSSTTFAEPQAFVCRIRKMAEAKINPKKNDQTNNG